MINTLIYVFFLILLIVISLLDVVEKTPFLESSLRTLVLIALLIYTATAFKRKILKKNTYLLAYSFLFALCILEITFSFIPRSHGTALAKSSKIWHDYYWRTNDWGYRDQPFSQKDTTKKKLVFIGDSFTAGHGIDNPENRFSNIVGNTLQKEYAFYNLAKQGHGPNNELQQLKYFPYKPDVVVYQYYMNDIERANHEVTGKTPFYYSYQQLPMLSGLLVKGSYLINYVYWLYPHDYNFDHRQYLLDAFSNPEVIHAHKQQLKAIHTFCYERGIPLIMIIYPFLDDPKTCAEPIATIKNIIPQDDLTTVIDMSAAIQSLPIEERIVNKNDAHPSEKVHALTAKKILLELRK